MHNSTPRLTGTSAPEPQPQELVVGVVVIVATVNLCLFANTAPTSTPASFSGALCTRLTILNNPAFPERYPSRTVSKCQSNCWYGGVVKVWSFGAQERKDVGNDLLDCCVSDNDEGGRRSSKVDWVLGDRVVEDGMSHDGVCIHAALVQPGQGAWEGGGAGDGVVPVEGFEIVMPLLLVQLHLLEVHDLHSWAQAGVYSLPYPGTGSMGFTAYTNMSSLTTLAKEGEEADANKSSTKSW
ncbi:hypothetical protein IAR50_005609 [Cryptococcus sp. DSM 104548]